MAQAVEAVEAQTQARSTPRGRSLLEWIAELRSRIGRTYRMLNEAVETGAKVESAPAKAQRRHAQDWWRDAF